MDAPRPFAQRAIDRRLNHTRADVPARVADGRIELLRIRELGPFVGIYDDVEDRTGMRPTVVRPRRDRMGWRVAYQMARVYLRSEWPPRWTQEQQRDFVTDFQMSARCVALGELEL